MLRNQIQGFQKLLQRISLCICRISLQPPQNENKTFQKLDFDFSYCKLPEFAGYFIPFKEGLQIAYTVKNIKHLR